MHKAQGINPLCIAQLNLPQIQTAFYHWKINELGAEAMSIAQCESHFTAANIQLMSAFPRVMSPSSVPWFLPGCWHDRSLSGEDGREFHHSTGSEAFRNLAPTSVKKVFCVSSSQRISSFITITFPVALWVTWWKEKPQLQARFKNT